MLGEDTRLAEVEQGPGGVLADEAQATGYQDHEAVLYYLGRTSLAGYGLA
jgi:hypothetical protein